MFLVACFECILFIYIINNAFTADCFILSFLFCHSFLILFHVINIIDDQQLTTTHL